jgi:hypothetical protein
MEIAARWRFAALLARDPALRQALEAAKAADPALASDA